MTDVADDSVVRHFLKVLTHYNVLASGGRHVYLTLDRSLVHCRDLVTFHRGLKSVYRIDFGYDYAPTQGTETLGAALAHVAVSSNDANLPGDHNVGGTLYAVDQGFPTSVEIVELALLKYRQKVNRVFFLQLYIFYLVFPYCYCFCHFSKLHM